MSGTLYGLGVGPGDPDLITVRARNVLAEAPVIAYPAPEGGTSLVRKIAAPHVPVGRTEIVISTPMATDRFPAQDVYDRYATVIGEHLEAGRDVALLCEGDPFLYGSFMYLFERLASHHPTRVVPGVSSLGAVAAVAGQPLVARNEVLSVLPAPMPEAVLEARLRAADAAAVMKVGRHLPKVRRVLERIGLLRDAWYVERATMDSERVMPLAELTEGVSPYFATVLVRRRHEDVTIGAVPPDVALVALSQRGVRLAEVLRATLPGARVHGLAGRTDGTDETFADAARHLRTLFTVGTPIVALCAAGIVVRALASVLADKRTEPPVVVVAEDGSAVVPLLGGHRGSNRLAQAVARVTGGTAAVTTAGEVAFGFALDDPPDGWHVSNPAAAKAVMAGLLAGEPVGLVVEAGDAGWLNRSGARFASDGSPAVRVTDRTVADPGDDLILHPPTLAVGVGCERGADAAEAIELVHTTLATAGLARASVTCVVSVDVKTDEPAVHAVADDLGVPARFSSAPVLETETPRLANPSETVFRAVGCHGVAEAAALAASGPDGTLVVAKTKSPRVTCAVARSTGDIVPTRVGRPQGRLFVVGTGPGAPEWRPQETTRAIAEATDVVGYRLYLDLIADLLTGKTRHESELTQEEARVRRALELAAEGRTVALVSSGDPGVYALGALVFEVLEHDGRDDWNRVAVTVAPGITAMQAAAARLGAPLGHDFCAVSLSDLLTPWAAIQRRIEAAATADFVVALYNPVSARRRTQLGTAREILLRHRAPETPVALARNIGRAGEDVRLLTLAELDATAVDMLTLVLVGSSQTRGFDAGGRHWLYTPRGYATKHEADGTPG